MSVGTMASLQCAKPLIIAKWSDSNPRGYVLTMLCNTHDARVVYSVAGGSTDIVRKILSGS